MKNTVNVIEWALKPRARKAGVKFNVAALFDVDIQKKSNQLKKFLKSRRERISEIDPETDNRLAGYRSLLASVNAQGMVASPEFLVQLHRKAGKLPQINTVVDSYNQVSAEQRVVVSAHDLDKITGDVVMDTAATRIEFQPLGSSAREWIEPGEWHVHDAKHSLCRLNCKQSRLSSISLETRNLLVYVQGNRVFSDLELDDVLRDVCETVIRFNGGNYVFLEQLT